MGTQVKVLRRKAFYGAGAICKIEIDGVVVGRVRNGEELTIDVQEGSHRMCFVADNGTLSGKILQRADFVAIDGENIVIEIQFNNSTGRLDIFSTDVVCESKNKKDHRPLVCGILLAFAAVGLMAMIVIIIMFPDSFRGNNIGNTPTTPQISYTQVDLQDMLDDLNANAMRAEEKYQNKYVEITGEIKSFDSDGKYISIAPSGTGIIGERVMCYLKEPAHKTFLLEKNVGDVVTIRGKIVVIGEVLGYHIDIAEISD